MERFIIQGGKQLAGEIKVNGAKNFALKILPAALLTDCEWKISNVPQINDVLHSVELLKSIGVSIEKTSEKKYRIQAKNISDNLDQNICVKIKTAVLMAGPMLARCGKITLSRAGGCSIGPRPHDIFWAGLKALGAEIKNKNDVCCLTAPRGLTGAKFVFPWVTVMGTEAMILAGVLAKGKTVLKNTACEPEIPALADFLNRCGAKIKGAGTPFIEIEGVKSLRGGECRIIPDRIEAGSFVLLGLATNSFIKITDLDINHLDALWASLEKVGADFELGKDYVQVKPNSKLLKAVELRTHEYPGFSTDLQSPFTVLMTQASGSSLIHETIFEKRLIYTDMLNEMGAKITMCDPHRVIVQGPTKLYGCRLLSPDIRAGIALVIAALTARGESVIQNICQIDRGYERLEERLVKLGADIRRVKD